MSSSLRLSKSSSSAQRKSRSSLSSAMKESFTEDDLMLSSPAEALEALLHSQLVTIVKIILRTSAAPTAHDVTTLRAYIDQRAERYVDDGLLALLPVLPGSPSYPQARMSALTQLSGSILMDLEHAVFDKGFHQKMCNLRDMNQSLQWEMERTQNSLSHSLAEQTQRVEDLEVHLKLLDAKNSALVKTVELLERALQKATRSITDLQQANLDLSMRGLDFKATVDQRCDLMEESVLSRIGFVPRNIEKQLTELRMIQAPATSPTTSQIGGEGSSSLLSSASSRGRTGRKSRSHSPHSPHALVIETTADLSKHTLLLSPASRYGSRTHYSLSLSPSIAREDSRIGNGASVVSSSLESVREEKENTSNAMIANEISSLLSRTIQSQ
eukprot:gene2526-2767_t